MVVLLKTRRDGFKQRYNLSHLRPKIKELYLKGLSSRETGKKIGISHTRVLNVLKTENINRRSVTKVIPNQSYKQLIPDRAYILGVMCGDGCVFSGIAQKKNWQYKLYVVHLSVKDKDFIDEFIRCVKNVYGVTPSLYYRERNKINKNWSNIWIAKITRKEIYNDLSSYKFGCKNWSVPQEVINSYDNNIIGSFLRGFYDSEGSVLKGPRSFGINVTSINSSGLLQIKMLLEKMKIKCSNLMIDKRPANPVFSFAISKKESLKMFLNGVGFAIQRKQNKIKEYLK